MDLQTSGSTSTSCTSSFVCSLTDDLQISGHRIGGTRSIAFCLCPFTPCIFTKAAPSNPALPLQIYEKYLPIRLSSIPDPFTNTHRVCSSPEIPKQYLTTVIDYRNRTPAVATLLLFRIAAGTVFARFEGKFREPIVHVGRFLAISGVVFPEGFGDARAGRGESGVSHPVTDVGIRRNSLDGGKFAFTRVRPFSCRRLRRRQDLPSTPPFSLYHFAASFGARKCWCCSKIESISFGDVVSSRYR